MKKSKYTDYFAGWNQQLFGQNYGPSLNQLTYGPVDPWLSASATATNYNFIIDSAFGAPEIKMGIGKTTAREELTNQAWLDRRVNELRVKL